MSWLKEFKAGGFGEQVKILLEISKKGDPGELEGLFNLYNNPLGDKPVDAMVEHTLRDLLNINEAETISRIESGTKKEKMLCIHICRVQNFNAVLPKLEGLVKQENDSELLEALFLCMAEFGDPQFIDTFRAYILHPDEVIAGVAISMVGSFQDESSLDKLKELLERAESRKNLHYCSLETAKAIQAIAEIGTEEAIACLVSWVHHKNPMARRIIHEQLVDMAEMVVLQIGELFRGSNTDKQIMAANVLGRIAARSGGNLLVAALERKCAEHANVRFAIYEALGFIRFSKGMVALIDGLKDNDELTLMAVVTALENQYNEYMGNQIKSLLESGELDNEKILTTVLTVKAVKIFEFLYCSEGPYAQQLMAAISRCPGQEVIEPFKQVLKTIGTDEALEHLKSVSQVPAGGKVAKKIRVMAVDDSVSMLAFYRAVCSGMAMDIETAENGQEAWQQFEEQGEHPFSLLIVDMNMPVMDGVQLTQKLRASEEYKSLPIIMATTESDKSQVRLAKKSGVSEFIIKPIKTKVLEKKLNKYLK